MGFPEEGSLVLKDRRTPAGQEAGLGWEAAPAEESSLSFGGSHWACAGLEGCGGCRRGNQRSSRKAPDCPLVLDGGVQEGGGVGAAPQHRHRYICGLPKPPEAFCLALWGPQLLLLNSGELQLSALLLTSLCLFRALNSLKKTTEPVNQSAC